jgi:hypothetical protein
MRDQFFLAVVPLYTRRQGNFTCGKKSKTGGKFILRRE